MKDTLILVLESADLREGFLSEAAAAGYSPEEVTGLPRHLVLRGVPLESFSLREHPSLAIVEEEPELRQEATQEVVLEADMKGTGGWPAARIIRRDDPWDPSLHRGYPRKSTFDCKRTGAGVDLYMIDAGAENLHPEFGGRATTPWWASTDYDDTFDDSGHGTHCLSVAGGSTVGIAREARLLTFKFYNDSGSTGSNALTAMGAIINHYQMMGADDRPGVMFFSWSGFSSSIDAAVSEMLDAGIVCCFPAGNDSLDLGSTVHRPAESDPDAIICGGLQMGDYPYYNPHTGSGTNYGEEVDILAPAQGTMGAQREVAGGGYRRSNGTSYATPMVAGVVACMLQGYRRLTSREQVRAVKAKLLSNATTGRLKNLWKDDGALTNVPDRNPWEYGTLINVPDRILYLDPNVEFEVIPTLAPRNP